ncbi:uncharacterized protein [Oryza sativa Japonica Group]|uniref:uncharacterized protein n=1 Tax=Oryza sativa subsp. japonica TaxID=39947 RepID=UPI00339CD4F7
MDVFVSGWTSSRSRSGHSLTLTHSLDRHLDRRRCSPSPPRPLRPPLHRRRLALSAAISAALYAFLSTAAPRPLRRPSIDFPDLPDPDLPDTGIHDAVHLHLHDAGTPTTAALSVAISTTTAASTSPPPPTLPPSPPPPSCVCRRPSITGPDLPDPNLPDAWIDDIGLHRRPPRPLRRCLSALVFAAAGIQDAYGLRRLLQVVEVEDIMTLIHLVSIYAVL